MTLEAPNYTQVPNELLEAMPLMSDAEFRCTMALARKIIGWHKAGPEPVSYSQLEEATGLSRQAVVNGIHAAIERGYVKLAGHGARGVNLYTLDIDDQSTTLTSAETTSQSSRPELVNVVDTQKKTKEKDCIDAPSAVNTATPPKKEQKPKPRDPVYDMVAEVIFGAKPNTAKFQSLKGRIGSHVSWLKGNTITVTRKDDTGAKVKVEVDGCRMPLSREQLLRAKADWYRANEGIHHPTDILKFISWIDGWIEKQVAKPQYEFTPPEERQREIQRLLLGEAIS